MSRTLMIQTRSSLNGELSQKLGVINETEELKKITSDLAQEINKGKYHNDLIDPNKNNLVYMEAYTDNLMISQEEYQSNLNYMLTDIEKKIDYFLQINFGYSINHAGLESHIGYYGDIPDEAYKLQIYMDMMGLRCPIVPINSNGLNDLKNDRINDHTHILELTICGMDNPEELKHYNRADLVKAIVLAFTPDLEFKYNSFFYKSPDNYMTFIDANGETVKNAVMRNRYWNEDGYMCTGLFKNANGDYMFGDDETGELARDGWFEAGRYTHNYAYADKDGIVISKDEASNVSYQKIMDGATYNFAPYLVSIRYGNVYDQHPKFFHANDGKLYPFVHNVK